MKSLFLIHCLMLLSLMASSQQYKLKVTNTRNNNYYYIKPGQNFNVIVEGVNGEFLKYKCDSVTPDGFIYASYRTPMLSTQTIILHIQDIQKLKVQPRNLFKTITKSVLTGALSLIPLYFVATYGQEQMPISIYNLTIVTMSGFAILAPQTAYGIPERIWLRLDKRLTRGRNLKIKVVPVHEEKPDQKYDFDR